MITADLIHRLKVYRERLNEYRIMEAHCPGYYQDVIAMHEREIWDMESDIAVFNLEIELKLVEAEVMSLVTDDVRTVQSLQANDVLLSCEYRWSWKHFKHMWFVEFYYTKS